MIQYNRYLPAAQALRVRASLIIHSIGSNILWLCEMIDEVLWVHYYVVDIILVEFIDLYTMPVMCSFIIHKPCIGTSYL